MQIFIHHFTELTLGIANYSIGFYKTRLYRFLFCGDSKGKFVLVELMGMFFEGGPQLQKDEYLIEVIILFNRTEFSKYIHEH